MKAHTLKQPPKPTLCQPSQILTRNKLCRPAPQITHPALTVNNRLRHLNMSENHYAHPSCCSGTDPSQALKTSHNRCTEDLGHCLKKAVGMPDTFFLPL
jgi:hypothetical protein